jgi:hypothetical protein
LIVVKRNRRRRWSPATESVEAGLERLVLRIVGMRVAAVRVRLPDFDERVSDWLAVTVDDATLDGDLSPVTPGQRGCR